MIFHHLVFTASELAELQAIAAERGTTFTSKTMSITGSKKDTREQLLEIVKSMI